MSKGKKSSKKPSPKKIPCSKADRDKAYHDGVDLGLGRGVRLLLYALIEKRGMDREEDVSLGKDVDYITDSINRGYISWEDIQAMLDEYDVVMELI